MVVAAAGRDHAVREVGGRVQRRCADHARQLTETCRCVGGTGEVAVREPRPHEQLEAGA